MKQFKLLLLAFLSFFAINTSAASNAEFNNDLLLYFIKDNYLIAVNRIGLGHQLKNVPDYNKVQILAELLIYGPTDKEKENGLYTILPPDTKIDSIRLEKNILEIKLSTNKDFLKYPKINDLISDLITKQFLETMKQVVEFNNFIILFKAYGSLEDHNSLDYYFPTPIYESKPYEEVSEKKVILSLGGPSGYGQGQPAGSLTGRTIFLSQSHGWYWNGSIWTTQRGVNCDIVEDFINAEAINQYLVQYLWNAGASVFTVRERGMDTNMVIVDNDGNNGLSTYEEIGNWFNSSLTGFANSYSPYQSGQDPFSFGTNKLANTNSTVTAQAIWTPYIPVSGYFPVYISYSGYTARATDAHYIIKHAGGQTDIRINQQIDGHTWKFVGEYYFYAGLNPQIGQVILQNDSVSGSNVSADAVRFGGGWGEIIRGSSVSSKPKWEECCRYNAQLLGAPESAYNPSKPSPDNDDNTDDVTCRPLYAEWEKESSETSLFISWHTNASVGGCTTSGSGTSTYVCLSSNSSYCADTEEQSVILQNYVHNELINDIRAEWDPGWQDRGKLNANFGEMRALSTMPGVLIELAFHDDNYDSLQLKQPKFRQLAARAIYQAIVKYFGINNTLLPEPPINLSVKNIAENTVLISWDAPPYGGAGGDPATGYRVYISYDGYSFQNALETNNTYFQLSNLINNKVYYIKVSATNAGGESFPTETLAIRTSSQQSKLLIVNGFDRIDRSMLIPKNDTIGTNMRMIINKMNAYNYIIQFAKSIDLYGISFDSASNEAIKNGYINLNDYCAVVWILGEESSADSTFDSVEQAIVKDYLDNNGNLFVSGAEIAWDLDWLNNGRSFYQNYLKAIYRDDDPYTNDEPINTVSGISGTIFDGMYNIIFDNGSGNTYNVDYPDVIDPNGGSIANLIYNGSSEPYINAGIQYDGSFKIINIGFPFETINNETERNLIMQRVLNFLTSGCSEQIPGEVPMIDGSGTPLLIQKDGAYLILTWGATNASCDTSNYAIYRGIIQSPFAYNHSYFSCNAGLDLQESIPAESLSYYYLIVALSESSEGSYGKSSSGIERPQGSSKCLNNQNNNTCS